MSQPAAKEPTIAAIATPAGPGGIGVIRVSGNNALAILTRLFVPTRPHANLESHRLIHGWIVDPDSQTPVDEVLAVYMASPRTYTRENVAEIHCHGSYLVLETILDLVLKLGAQHAAPGEFTKRAFINGRIDLTQAEAVAELLEAKTRQGLQLAVNQLHGRLHEKVESIRDQLVGILAICEVAIDFPEDDVDILNPDELTARICDEIEAPLTALIASADQGRIYRDGISAVILGRPNVGKSSLLNSLLKEERAIVTPVPGTTRDTIEEYLDIKGMPVRIIDTAGIREQAEEVEEIGIQRARAKLAAADLVLLLVDASLPPASDDISLFTSITDKPVILVANKMDIAIQEQAMKDIAAAFPTITPVPISAKTETGIDQLEEAIFTAVARQQTPQNPDHACVPNLRHKNALKMALTACQQIKEGLANNLPADLIAVDLQAALDHLGDIVGKTTTEDVLEMIFERFCIGK
ncbi:MAG: tRNA uridine-5-carboxymethylaminomethyl(34) synthesis GTPase MnmE [Desulfobulbaceae bacterium]|nr:tRNA uridine-5-carboxymethylaminomethyl(34) synthesis GTPase MnmE [Desulfobulbaceae bacterium]